MANNFEATVKLITEVDYSSIEKVDPSKVAKRLSKAYGPVTKKLFRDPFLDLSKEYAKASMKFYDKGKMKSFARDMQSEYAKAAVKLTEAKAMLEKDSGNVMAKTQAAEATKEMKGIEARYKKRLEKEEEVLAYRKDALGRVNEKAQESWSETAKRWGGNLLSTSEKATSLLSGASFGDIAKLGMEAGTATKEKGEEIEVKGLDESASKMEEAAGTFAKGAKTFAAVTAGTLTAAVASLVKLIMMAVEHAEKMNKQILEGAGALDLGAKNAEDLEKNLSTIRGATEDMGLVVRFRATAEENARILQLLNQQGVTYKKLAGDIEDTEKAQKNFVEVIEQAHTFSNLLGVSLDEITQMQATMIKNFGYSTDTMEDAFRAIAKGAEIAGFNTKRFYSMVLQATSGMAAHNVRIEEASALLATFGKALGTNAEKMLSTVAQGFAGEGMTERFKRIMTTGGKTMQNIFSDASERVSRKFFEDFTGQSKNIIKAFDKAGINIKGLNIKEPEGQREVIKKLSALSPKKQAELIAQVRSEGGDEMARQFSKLVDISKGTTGRLGDMAKSLGKLDFTGNFVASLKQANAVIGKPLSEMSAMEQAAFEQITGISGEQREMLSEVSRMLEGNKAILDQELELAKKRGEISQKQQAELAKKFGATIQKTDEGFKIMAATTKEVEKEGRKELQAVISDSEVKSAEDLASANEEAFSKMVEEPLSKELQLAQQVVKETTSIKKIMEGGIQNILGQIYDAVLAVIDLLPGNRMTEDEKERRSILMEQLALQKEALSEQQLNVQEQISTTESALETATGEERKGLEKTLESLRTQNEAFASEIEKTDETTKNLMRMTEGGTSKNILGEIEGKELTQEEMLARAQKGEGQGLEGFAAQKLTSAQMASRGAVQGFLSPGGGGVEGVKGLLKLFSKDEEGSVEAKELQEKDIEQSEELSEEEKKHLEELQKEKIKEEDKKHKDITDLSDEQIDELIKLREDRYRGAVAELGLSPAQQQAALDALVQEGVLPPHIANKLTEEQKARFASAMGRGGVDDFIVNDQGITPINKKDQIVGFKPGGPIDRGGLGGQTVNNIEIHVYGTGKAAVMQALHELGLTK